MAGEAILETCATIIWSANELLSQLTNLAREQVAVYNSAIIGEALSKSRMTNVSNNSVLYSKTHILRVPERRAAYRREGHSLANLNRISVASNAGINLMGQHFGGTGSFGTTQDSTSLDLRIVSWRLQVFPKRCAKALRRLIHERKNTAV